MKNTNVKVIMNNEGQVQVIGIKKDGTVSNVNYVVTEVEGLREFAVEMMKAGAKKASEPKASEQPVNDKVSVNQKGYKAVETGGELFSKPKVYRYHDVYHAVGFTIAGKGECIVGFAKDRNAFIEHYNGNQKETTRAEVLKRLAKYEGKDAALVVKAVKNLKPVTTVSGNCSCCGVQITRGVKEYSVRNYGAVLCRDCQTDFRTEEKAPSVSEAQQTNTCACGNEKLVASSMCSSCADMYEERMLDQELKELDELMIDKEGGTEYTNEGVTDEEIISDADKASEERTSAVEEDANELESKGAVDPMTLFDQEELIAMPGYKA